MPTRTLFIPAVADGEVGTLAEDVTGQAETALIAEQTGGYYYKAAITSGTSRAIATCTPTFDASSMAVAVGFAHCRPYSTTAFKMQIVMGGVQVAEGAFIPADDSVEILIGFRALSGAQVCLNRIHNYSTDFILEHAGHAQNEVIGAGIGVGSIKLV